MKITRFTMENVRCFAERQTLEIRPLTFLVGENSTGKTTALGCFQVLANYLKGERLDFNVDPYVMGTFGDIVRQGGETDRSFTLGFTFAKGNETVDCAIACVEREGGFEPATQSLGLTFPDGEILFMRDDALGEYTIALVWAEKERNLYHLGVASSLFDLHMPPFVPLDHLVGGISLYGANREGKEAIEPTLDQFLFGKYWDILRGESTDFNIMERLYVVSSSPIRSQPKRTYDLTVAYGDSGGSDVPMRLMRVEALEKEEWTFLERELNRFGRRSGLFQSIGIRSLGSARGAPFQLAVNVRGPESNIVDVGYGVSQILPVLVQAVLPPVDPMHSDDWSGSTYHLMQQPEVHLHPRAQAELSSLFVRLAGEGRQSFIVETHSDYMIDRARIEIMHGNIDKDDVSLIFFEPGEDFVKVHNISFDEMGNMIGVPPHFRAFFLEESSRLMGFAEL